MSIIKWSVDSIDKNAAIQLAQECDIDAFTALLLLSRGMDDASQAGEFLSDEPIFCEPYELADMQAAVQRIRLALEKGEKIAVYADYDCDGVTACTLLCECLRSLGGSVCYRLPTREEGYGMSSDAVSELKADGVSLIITVDNGISAHAEIAHAKTLGIDVIVTDHHIPQDTLPDAVAVVDPKRADSQCEFRDYAGVGVAFMLACALKDSVPEELIYEYGDLVALGTIADVMPLKYDNRYFVIAGLTLINNSQRAGIKALIKVAGLDSKPLTAQGCAYGLCPRINAAGRVVSPELALQLLLCEDEQTAQRIAEQLVAANALRQQLEREILQQAQQSIESDSARQCSPFITVYGDGWHHGVIGIVAARLCNLYQKPCAVFSVDNGVATGSCRSFDGVSVYDILQDCSSLLTRFGGHSGAAGMSLPTERLPDFAAAAAESVRRMYGFLPFAQQHACCKLNPKKLKLDYAYAQNRLQPFGAQNEQPVYGLFGMSIESVTPVGAGRHLRLSLLRDGVTVTAMRFGCTFEQFGYKAGDVADFLVTLDVNSYNERESLSLIIKDIHPSGTDYDSLCNDLRRYEYYRAFGQSDGCKAPTREQLGEIYKLIRAERRINMSEDRLCKHFKTDCFTLLISLDILAQLGLISFSRAERVCITYTDNVQRVDLEQSAILKSLRGEVS